MTGTTRPPLGGVSEAGFEHVFDAALDVILLIDPESGEIVRANRAVERLLGYAPARLQGRHFSVLFPVEVWATPADLLADVRVHGAQFAEQAFQRADGTTTPMDLNATLTTCGSRRMLIATLRDASERQQAAAALRDHKERLELVVRGADLGLWDWNIESGAVVFNARAAEMLGYGPEEIAPVVQTWDQMVHPDDRERVRQLMRRHLRGETASYGSEHRLRSKSGEWVWILHRGKVVRRDADGRPLRATGTQFDVTDRKRSEEDRAALLALAKELSGTLALRELAAAAERQAAAVLPADVVLTVYWDADLEAYRLVSYLGLDPDCAAAAAAIRFALGDAFGGRLTAGETVAGDRAAEWGGPESALLTRAGIAATAAAPLLIRGQVRGALCAGNRSGLRFSSHHVHLLEGMARQLAVAVETASLYRAQQAEAQYSAALARVGQVLISSIATPAVHEELCRITCAVLGCDVSATFLWSPREAAYVVTAGHGDTAERWASLQVVRLSAPLAAGVVRALQATGLARVGDLAPDDAVRQALETAHGMTSALLVGLRRGEQLVGFHAVGYRERRGTFGAQQERIARGVARIASLALDNARLVEELERANRIKSEFVATMSHELRTPLNVIIGYHDLLLGGEFGPLADAQRERLQRADQSARELLDLINATLDLSRLEARQVPLHVHDVDLRAMVEQLDTDLAAVRRKPGLEFTWQLPPAMPALRSDAVKIKVVLKNLIQNAIKFTDVGCVSVAIGAGAGRVEFSVTDTGIGIAPEVQAAIFEPFRQADSSSTRSYGGVGLGLYIVQRLLDLLGGGITVDSQPGRGSTFRFWVPSQPPV